jgi:DNA-binding transcriptional LysR family regulator
MRLNGGLAFDSLPVRPAKSLTEVGAAYLQKVRVILAELAAADVEAAEGAARPRGLLRVTMPRTFARLWVVPWLPAFLRDYPEIEIELELGDRYFDLVAEGFDLAIRLGGLADSSLIVRHLASFETILCASPAYLAEAGMPRTLEDLQNHRCLRLKVPNFWPDWRLRRGDERVTVLAPAQFRPTMVAAWSSQRLVGAASCSPRNGLAAGTLLRAASFAFFRNGEWITRGTPRLCFRQDGSCPPKHASSSSEWLPSSARWHLGTR